MADEQTPEPPPWTRIPEGMAVASTPKAWSTNLGTNGTAWLWIRSPNGCQAFDFDPDSAEHLGNALIKLAEQGRMIRGQQVEVVERKLLLPGHDA